MASVTLQLPEHTHAEGNQRIRWEGVLGDVSAVGDGGGVRHLLRLQFTGNNGRAQLAASQVATGSPTTDGQDLSDEWETHTEAITVSVPGLADLVLQGPNGPDVAQGDDSERYIWTPGENGTPYQGGVAQWVTDFVAAYAADNTLRATLTLDDGQAPPVTERGISFGARAGSPAAAFAFAGEAVAERGVSFSGRAGSPTAALAFEGEAVTERGISFGGRAGSPVATFGFAVKGITERGISLSGRAGNPAAAFAFGPERAGLVVALGAPDAPGPAARTVLAHAGDRVLDGAESATQRLHDALLIVRGSYPVARDYGSLLVSALDRSLGPRGIGALSSAVADAIAHPANGLADVRLRSVHVAADAGVVTLDIQADWVSQAGTLTPIGLREQLAAR